jgi:hypothetical protein
VDCLVGSGELTDDLAQVEARRVSAIFEFLGKLLELLSKRLPGARRDAKRKATLRGLLEEGPKWRSIGALAGSIGASEETTKGLLNDIGARGSVGENKEMWGLKGRVDAP